MWRSSALALLVACHGSSGHVGPDAPLGDGAAPGSVTITATVNSTRFVTREHMLAAGEMQISGEPLAQAMGRDLTGYSRDLIPPNIYVDHTSGFAWIDLPGFSTGVESYEYSKQPMNELAFESGAGTALSYAPLVGSDAALTALVQHFAGGSNATNKWVFAPGTFPANNVFGDSNPTGAGDPAHNPIGWPGIWPTAHVFASFDPALAPTSDVVLQCSISSDDNPSESGGQLICSDFECDATTLHLPDRATQIEPTLTPGADGFSAWKYALWTLNYLQIMHDSTEAAVAFLDDPSQLGQVGVVGNTIVGDDGTGAPTAAGTYLGSSDIEGFQAQMFVQMLDARAADWLLNFATADGYTLTGFPSIAAALAYDEAVPLRWFPAQISVTESDAGGLFPKPAYALTSADSHLLDQLGLILGYATIYALTDTRNADVGGSQPALAYFDGDPFPADNQLADGESTLHDRALAIIRVAFVNLDRQLVDPRTGTLVDDMMGSGTSRTLGSTISTTSAAYSVIALRTASRALSSQLELYSNETPDTAGVASPLDALPLHRAENPTETFGQRIAELLRAQAELLYNQLTDATGRAYDGWNLAGDVLTDQLDTLDAHAAAVRGLFAAYLATGDEKYRARAIAVFDRMTATFYDPVARVWSATPAPVTSVEYTPLRFALLQSALREYYELVASRPGNEALEPVVEGYLARLNKLVLNGWDDRDYDKEVEWPAECVNVDATGLPRGGLQMAERTLTGETGRLRDEGGGGSGSNLGGPPTTDREQDCVPAMDAAKTSDALADSITFTITRSQP